MLNKDNKGASNIGLIIGAAVIGLIFIIVVLTFVLPTALVGNALQRAFNKDNNTIVDSMGSGKNEAVYGSFEDYCNDPANLLELLNATDADGSYTISDEALSTMNISRPELIHVLEEVKDYETPKTNTVSWEVYFDEVGYKKHDPVWGKDAEENDVLLQAGSIEFFWKYVPRTNSKEFSNEEYINAHPVNWQAIYALLNLGSLATADDTWKSTYVDEHKNFTTDQRVTNQMLDDAIAALIYKFIYVWDGSDPASPKFYRFAEKNPNSYKDNTYVNGSKWKDNTGAIHESSGHNLEETTYKYSTSSEILHGTGEFTPTWDTKDVDLNTFLCGKFTYESSDADIQNYISQIYRTKEKVPYTTPAYIYNAYSSTRYDIKSPNGTATGSGNEAADFVQGSEIDNNNLKDYMGQMTDITDVALFLDTCSDIVPDFDFGTYLTSLTVMYGAEHTVALYQKYYEYYLAHKDEYDTMGTMPLMGNTWNASGPGETSPFPKNCPELGNLVGTDVQRKKISFPTDRDGNVLDDTYKLAIMLPGDYTYETDGKIGVEKTLRLTQDDISSRLSAAQFSEVLGRAITASSYRNTSILYDTGSTWYAVQNDYKLSGLGMAALACWESGYGSSTKARERYNFFGWKNYNDNPDAAQDYSSLGTKHAAIMSTCHDIAQQYIWSEENGYGCNGKGCLVSYDAASKTQIHDGSQQSFYQMSNNMYRISEGSKKNQLHHAYCVKGNGGVYTVDTDWIENCSNIRSKLEKIAQQVLAEQGFDVNLDGSFTDAEQARLELLLSYLENAIGANYADPDIPEQRAMRMKEGWYDCSSLVQRAYKYAGVTMDGTSKSIYSWARARNLVVTRAQIRPGTVLVYSNNGSPSGIHHVAVYIGNGEMIEANPGGVKRKAMREATYFVDPLRWFG